MNRFEILIASLPHRERPVAEIFYDNICWVEISYEDEEVVAQFYNHPYQKCWTFQYDKALKVLDEAKNFLLEI